MIHYALDKDNNVIEVSREESWEFFEKNRKHVADDSIEVILKLRVSTVFLCTDHNHFGIGAPILFETMIFDGNGNDIYCKRYCTYAEAVKGHKLAIEIANKSKFIIDD